MTSVNEVALLRAILDDPADDLPRLAYADALEERGDPVLAHAYRWMAARGKRPHERMYYLHQDGDRKWRSKVPDAYRWAWWPEWTHSSVRSREVIHDCHTLPRLVFLAVSRNRKHYFCGSLDDAVAALADGLELMRAQREANP